MLRQFSTDAAEKKRDGRNGLYEGVGEPLDDGEGSPGFRPKSSIAKAMAALKASTCSGLGMPKIMHWYKGVGIRRVRCC